MKDAPKIRVIALAVALSALGGCTVRPLYGEANSYAMGSVAPTLALKSVSVSEPRDRLDLEVRNELIFLLYGGEKRSDDAKYQVSLQAYANDLGSPVAGASSMQVTAVYAVIDNQTGKTISSGSRSIASAYDAVGQQYASLRVRRDAENRAAREAAHLVFAEVAAAIRKHEMGLDAASPKR